MVPTQSSTEVARVYVGTMFVKLKKIDIDCEI